MKTLATLLLLTAVAAAAGGEVFSWGEPKDNPLKWEWGPDDIPPHFKRYKSARYTQRIAVTNGRDTIQPVARSSQEEKWRSPGGLSGVAGWRSDLFKWADGEEWVGNISVLNSLGYFQNNRGWKRSYSDGSEFLDVLTNTTSGKVFEVRKAIKKDGSWQRFVTYRDAAQRPKGYAGPGKLDCRGCHSESGSGQYGVGLIPGGDSVFSDAFEALEQPEQQQSRMSFFPELSGRSC